MAQGVDREPDERYADGNKSLWFNCAEQITLARAFRKGANIKGARLYVTLMPCSVCAGLIIECGLRQVIVPADSMAFYETLKPKWRKRVEIAQTKFLEAGVQVISLDMK